MLIDAITILLLIITIALLILILRYSKDNQNTIDHIRQHTSQLFNQIEAYNYIRDRLQLKHGLPYTTNWSASPDFLKIICNHTLSERPKTILECSSGLSSLVLAKCCETNKTGKVFSLENDKKYADQSRSNIERYSLQNWCTIIHAPLSNAQLSGREYQWYAIDNLPETSIDLLVIDGPPGYIQFESRFPALPLLYDKLSNECTIILDDASRADEKHIVEKWLSIYPDLQHKFIHTERGCSVLQLKKKID